MAFSAGSFLAKHDRFYLHAARTGALDPLTDSPELLAALEAGYAVLWKELTGTALEECLEGENAAVLYHAWMAGGAEAGGTRLSVRASAENLDHLMDEGNALRELVTDSIAWLREQAALPQPDPDALLVLAVNVELAERKGEYLADPVALNQAMLLREGFVALAARARERAPLEKGRDLVPPLVTGVFLANVVYRAMRRALDALALCESRAGVLRLRPACAAEGRLLPACYEVPFLQANLDALAAARALFAATVERIGEAHFPAAHWGEDGELLPVPLLLARLWDDRGLLGRLPAAALCLLCRGAGPLREEIDAAAVQAARGAEGLLAIRRLTELAAEAREAAAACLVPAFPDLPAAEGLLARAASYERLLREKEQALAAAVRGLREEVGKLNVDHSGLLDPVIEHLLPLVPAGAALEEADARDLLFFSRRAGPLYEPVQRALDEGKRHVRYVRELRLFQEERIGESLRLAAEGDREGARAVLRELERVFDDLDYAGADAAAAEPA